MRSGAWAVLAAMLGAPAAFAADCSTVPNAVYIVGSSKLTALMAGYAAAYDGGSGVTPVYLANSGDCAALTALQGGTPSTGPFTYYDASSHTNLSCTVADAGVTPNVVVTTLAPSSCTAGSTAPLGFTEVTGSVLPLAFIVPLSSGQTAISAEAAHVVFKYGGSQFPLVPWIDSTHLFIRSSTSATQILVALAIGLSPSLFMGNDQGSEQTLVDAVRNSVSSDATIGIVFGDVYEAQRATIRLLAYQDRGQKCGYGIDSDMPANDRRNVRDGHYALWTQMHYFYEASSPNGQLLAKQLTSDASLGEAAERNGMILAEQAGQIPVCAMQVTRATDMGPLASFPFSPACGCAFENDLGTHATDCFACTSDPQCSTNHPAKPKCNFGFCEAE